jgi:hypothetical protein
MDPRITSMIIIGGRVERVMLDGVATVELNAPWSDPIRSLICDFGAENAKINMGKNKG